MITSWIHAGRVVAGLIAFCCCLDLEILSPAIQAKEVRDEPGAASQIRDQKKGSVTPPKDVPPLLPANLNVVAPVQDKKSSSVVLRDVKYAGATALGRPVSGTADLSLTLVGHPLPLLKNAKFTGTVHDKLGKNSGMQIAVSEDLVAKRFLGSKFDLVLEKGGEIVEEVAQRGMAPSHKFRGSIRIHLPFATENGKPVEAHMGRDTGRKAIEIPLSAAGFTLTDQQVAIPPTTLIVDGFKFPGVKLLGGVRLKVDPQQSKPCSLETTLNNAPVIAYLPRFLLKEGFQAYAQQVTLEAGGGSSDDGAATFSAKTLVPPKLEFIRPAGFSLDCKGTGKDKDKEISLKVVNGDYTDAVVEGKLYLPKNFKEKPQPKTKPKEDGKKKQVDKNPQEAGGSSGASQPADCFIDAKLTYSTGKGRFFGWSTVGSGGFAPTWNDGQFGLIVDYTTKYSLQLDGPGGIKVTGGKFFSAAFKDGIDNPIELPLKTGDEFFLQSTGASGQITISPQEIGKVVYPGAEEYQVLLSGPATTWRFNQSRLTAVQKFTGKMVVQSAKSDADLAVKITVNTDGKATASLNGGTLSMPGYGLYFAVAHGDYKYTNTNPPPNSTIVKKPVFLLSGTITFDVPSLPQLKDVAVPVSDVIFNTDGFFGDPLLKDPPKSIPLGQIDVDLKSFILLLSSFSLPSTHQYNDKNVSDPHLNLNGMARISEEIIVDYPHGLRVAPTKNTSHRSLNPDRHFVVAEAAVADLVEAAEVPGIPEYGEIKVQKPIGDFAYIDFTLRKEVKLFGGKMTDCLFGDGTLKLGDGPGGSLTMFVAGGSWLVFGNVVPPAAIPLGNSGLQIYAFRGGLGQNINVKPNVLSPGNAAGKLAPDDFVYAPGNFIFQAGVGIATKDDYLVWGDAMLTITTTPVTMTVSVAANIFEYHDPNPNKKPSGDRTATGSLAITGSYFSAQLAADLNFPSRSLRLASITGTAELYIGGGNQHLYLGWPLPDKAAGVSLLNGLVSLKGGMGLDVTQKGPVYEFRFGTGFIWRENFLGIVKGQLDGSLYASITKEPGNTNLKLGGNIHLFGEVDFYVFSASAEAWLGGDLSTSPFELHLYGGIQGCIGTPLGDACASVSFDATW